MGKWIGKVLPSCVVTAVRQEFPEEDGIYTGIKIADL